MPLTDLTLSLVPHSGTSKMTQGAHVPGSLQIIDASSHVLERSPITPSMKMKAHANLQCKLSMPQSPGSTRFPSSSRLRPPLERRETRPSNMNVRVDQVS